MNMLEALKAVWDQPETLAARPVTWNGVGVGILRIGDMFVIVTQAGLALSPIPGNETFGEWETVTTDTIDTEVENLQAAEKLVNHGKDPEPVVPDVQPDPTQP
jgi:hypothetical protein